MPFNTFLDGPSSIDVSRETSTATRAPHPSSLVPNIQSPLVLCTSDTAVIRPRLLSQNVSRETSAARGEFWRDHRGLPATSQSVNRWPLNGLPVIIPRYSPTTRRANRRDCSPSMFHVKHPNLGVRTFGSCALHLCQVPTPGHAVGVGATKPQPLVIPGPHRVSPLQTSPSQRGNLPNVL